ncbi:MAG: hypothetical protein WA705_13495 [Candidatus Ozemobacteraceae bacterium]
MFKKISLMTVLFVLVLNLSAFAADLMTLIPENIVFLSSLNLTKMLGMEEVKKQLEDSINKQSPDQKKIYDEFLAKTGFEVTKDLKEVIFFATKLDSQGGKPEGAAVFSGNFQVEKLIAFVKESSEAGKSAIVEKFEGFDAIKTKNENEGLAVFIDKNTVVIGMPKDIKMVIDVKGGKAKSVSGNAAFTSLLKKADTAASIWGVGQMPANTLEHAKNAPNASFPGISLFTFAFNYSSDISFSFLAETAKKEEAANMVAALNGMVVQIKAMAAKSPEAVGIVNMIKVEAVGNAVKVALNVPKDKFEELKKLIMTPPVSLQK